MDAEARSRHLLRAYRTLAEVLAIEQRVPGEAELLDEVCRIAVDAAGYRLAWVGYAEAGHRVRPVASSGYEHGYLETIQVTWDETVTGQGPTGRAIRSGRPVVAQHLLTAPGYEPWRAEASRRGYAASAALPIAGPDRVMGALNLYAADPNAFDADELDLLERVTAALGHAIACARGREQMSALQEGLRRLAVQDTAARVAAVIAHDVNNCLTVLATLTSLVPKDATEIAQSALSRAIGLNRELMRLGRSGAPPPAAPLDLDATLSRMAVVLRPAALPSTLALELGAGCEVRVGAGRLEQAITNLVLNARDAMPKGGEIRVRTRRLELRHPMNGHYLGISEGTYASIEVIDQGLGVPPEVRERLFEPFFTTKAQGTGLGLVSVSATAKEAGGTVLVESSPGKGTTFELLLPVG